MAGDVGIVPRNMGHFVENLSDDEPLEVLEIFRDVNGTQIVSLIGSFSASSIFFKNSSAPLGSPGNTMGHFVENLSDDEPLEVLEIFRADRFRDFSLFQWLSSYVNGTQIVSLIGSFSASSIFFKNSSAPLGSLFEKD
jgi:oxalate decarboxylase/phosphoglucose isomerase-like protein (cupin superfamily)